MSTVSGGAYYSENHYLQYYETLYETAKYENKIDDMDGYKKICGVC